MCVGAMCFVVTSTFRVTILGFGSERDRAVRFVTFVDRIVSNTPALKEATFLELDLECTPLINGDECTEDPQNPRSRRSPTRYRHAHPDDAFPCDGGAAGAPPESASAT